MAGYEVLIKPSALKELDSLGTRKLRRAITAHIQALAGDPRPHGCRRLAEGDRYRIRYGTYRVVYSVDDALRTVLVVKIGHRRDIYR